MTSTHAAPTHGEIERIVAAGFYVQSLAGDGYNHLVTIDVMKRLLATYNESTFNNTDAGAWLAGRGLNPYQTVQKLAAVIPTLTDETNTTKEIVYYVTMLLIMLAFVALRLYSRLRISPKKMNKEDWACIVAAVWVTVLTIAIWCRSVKGLRGYAGHHIYTLTLEQMKWFCQYITANEAIFHVTHFFVKMTFLVFYHRLNPNPIFRRVIYAVAFFLFSITICGVFVAAFQCKPFDYWNHFATAVCIDQVTSAVSVGIMFIVADFTILLVPIPAVWRLKLKTTEKLLVCGMFGLGAFISIVSVIRVLALKDWLSTIDLTWSVQKHAKWALLELDLSIIVSCAPAVKLFFYRGTSAEISRDKLPRGEQHRLSRVIFRKGSKPPVEDESAITGESSTLGPLERYDTASAKDEKSLHVSSQSRGDEEMGSRDRTIPRGAY